MYGYNFRQIELMIHNFPTYSWFDPMTAYPVGKSLDWGPLLIFIGAGICLLFGMTSRPDMMVIVSWIGPIFAAFMVPLIYYLGKRIWDWKTGLMAAAFFTVLPGTFIIQSSFGNVDHHYIETFLSTLFCILYLFTLFYWRSHSSELKKYQILIVGTGLSLLTGISYFTGYLNMPTIIIFGLIVAIYTFFQFIMDKWQSKSSEYILISNIMVFSPVIIFMSIFGIQQQGMSLQQYSIAQIYAIFVIIAETVIFYILSKKIKNNNKLFFLSILGIIIASIAGFRILFGNIVLLQLTTFFGQQPSISTITESVPWNFTLAFISFNFALFLAFIGFIILLYQLYKKKQPDHLFLVIWSLIAFFATVQHFRYEYYFVVNMALLSSLCIVMGITTGLNWLGPDIRIFNKSVIHLRNYKANNSQEVNDTDKKYQGKNERKKYLHANSRKSQHFKIIGAFLVVGLIFITILTAALSIQNSIKYTTAPDRLINQNWVETMEWLSNHTPDPGLEYFGQYEKNHFSYPPQSYGILAWWDFGHYITFISKRIPNTNPFQDNLIGSSGAAAFFMADSEQKGSKILDKLGTRYVITDTSTATEKFHTVAIWNNSETGVNPYIKSFFQTDPTSNNQLLQLNGELPPYYLTMIARLHNFDGTMQIPGKITYLEYYDQNREGLLYPMVTNVRILNVTNAKTALGNFRQNDSGNRNAILVGQYLQPLERVPALQHFRLVHESPGNSSGIRISDNSGSESLNLVKVFEFVKGAHIKGQGVIELQVVTNTGRIFTYRQESSNGEFIVPYSTMNNPYEVQANGKYHIIGTNKAIDVSEEDILQGKIIES